MAHWNLQLCLSSLSHIFLSAWTTQQLQHYNLFHNDILSWTSFSIFLFTTILFLQYFFSWANLTLFFFSKSFDIYLNERFSLNFVFQFFDWDYFFLDFSINFFGCWIFLFLWFFSGFFFKHFYHDFFILSKIVQYDKYFCF